MIDRTRIDPVRCERGLDCLRNYCRAWNEKTRTWSEGEFKDWTNHGCDAIRMFATSYDEPRSPLGERRICLSLLIEKAMLIQLEVAQYVELASLIQRSARQQAAQAERPRRTPIRERRHERWRSRPVPERNVVQKIS
jgi:hypothetical protein